MSRNEAQTRRNLIDTATFDRCWTNDIDKVAITPGGADIVCGKPIRRKGWSDYSLYLLSPKDGALAQFRYILTNPPFGSKEGKAAQSSFAYRSGKAQILFLQLIISSLEDGGTCVMVIDEGVLFHTKTKAYTQTKRILQNDCDLFCIVSLQVEYSYMLVQK